MAVTKSSTKGKSKGNKFRNKDTEKSNLVFDVTFMKKYMNKYMNDHYGELFDSINKKISISKAHIAMAAGLQKLSYDVIKEVYNNTDKGNDNMARITFSNFKTTILANPTLSDCFLKYIQKYQDMEYEVPMYADDIAYIINSIDKNIMLENSACRLYKFLIKSLYTNTMRFLAESMLAFNKSQINERHVKYAFSIQFDKENIFNKNLLKFIDSTISRYNEACYDDEGNENEEYDEEVEDEDEVEDEVEDEDEVYDDEEEDVEEDDEVYDDEEEIVEDEVYDEEEVVDDEEEVEEVVEEVKPKRGKKKASRKTPKKTNKKRKVNTNKN